MPWTLTNEQRDGVGIERVYRWDDGGHANMVLSVVWQEVGYDLIITFGYEGEGLEGSSRPGRQECRLPWPSSTLVWQLLCQAQVKSGDHWSFDLPETFGPESVTASTLLGLSAELGDNYVRRDDFYTMRRLVREDDERRDREFLAREDETEDDS